VVWISVNGFAYIPFVEYCNPPRMNTPLPNTTPPIELKSRDEESETVHAEGEEGLGP